MLSINYAKLFHPYAFTARPATKAIILHHAVMDGSVYDVNQVHLNRLFNGIGYHFYVRKDGSIWSGRALWAIGAGVRHVGYYTNNNTVHICAEGNFEKEHMSDKQVYGIVKTILYLYKEYGELPVIMHRNINNTACPGRLYPIGKILIAVEREDTMDKQYLVQIPTKIDTICETKVKVEKATGYKFYINPDFTISTKANETSLKEIISKCPYKIYYNAIK